MSLFRRAETRSLSYEDVWGSGGDWTQTVGVGGINGALRLAPVYSATSLIANLISTSPIKGYREPSAGILEPLARQPQLVRNPSPWGQRIDWWHQGIVSALLTGNAWGYIVDIDAAGIPTKIIWFNPYDVEVIEEQHDMMHAPTYYWRGRPLDPSLLVHVGGYAVPGTVVCKSPIGLFKKQIETGMSAQDFQLDWYQNGAAPSGWFKNTAKALKPGDADKIKSRFKAAVKNRDLLVTGSDWDWQALAVPADEARFLEAIRANATTIASIYHVSPEYIGGEVDRSLTYKTLEQDGIKLISHALRPWAARFEAALSALLPGTQHVKVSLDAVAQGTQVERVQAHAIALATGQETNTEARADFGRAPLTPDEAQAWRDDYAGKANASGAAGLTAGGAKGEA